MQHKSILFIFILCICISFVSATGLRVTNQSVYTLDKFSGQNYTFTFDLKNEEAFSFYNVSVYNSSGVSLPKIQEITPGQTIKVSATIFSDSSFNSKIKVKGQYVSNIGASNKSYNLTVDFYNGVSKCDFTIVRGDSITWSNLVNDDILMRNSETYNDVVTIQKGGNYTSNFDSPTTFPYFFLRRGYIFTNPCTITAISDVGQVNNPELDGELTLAVNIIYSPTNVTFSLLERNYTVNALQSQDGVMSVTNVGTNIARNISLRADWFSFSPNNFDLTPGQTRGITYTIRPSLSTTNDTGKSYTKVLTISSNFPTLTDSFTINVPYTNLNNLANSSAYASLFDLIKLYCNSHPQESFCQTAPPVIYSYGNGTGNFNVTFGQEQVKGIFDMMFQTSDDLHVANNFNKEKFDSMDKQVADIKGKIDSLLTGWQTDQADRTKQSSFWKFVSVSAVFLIIGGMLFGLIMVYIRKNKIKNVERWN